MVLLLMALLTGCTASGSRGTATGEDEGFPLRDIGKTDVDQVTELSLSETFDHLRELMELLYRRNPEQLRRGRFASIEEAEERIFYTAHRWSFAACGERFGSDCLMRAFEPGFDGDRVQVFIVGLGGMLHTAYDGKTEFYLFDGLNAQSLYNSARNVEIAAWRLRYKRRPDGHPWLDSRPIAEPERRLDVERLFGKIIAQQDTLAKIVARTQQRTIKNVIQRAASAAFLPI